MIGSARSSWVKTGRPAWIPPGHSSTAGLPIPGIVTKCCCSWSTACGCRRVPILRPWTCSAGISTVSPGACTLGPDGTPLLYDSIHNCGCYHQFFPTSRAELLPRQDTLDEQAFVPQRLPHSKRGSRIEVRLESGNPLHPARAGGGRNEWSQLCFRSGRRRCARCRFRPGHHRSAFRTDGIVAGSERGERYLFWPMGVREPGAMRQWGRHATAFIGRRQFDEARLMERYFTLRLD